MTHALRHDLPALPERIAKLPVDKRGFPVPWFVSWVDGEPEFRAADGRKIVQAVREHLCWVCGQRLGSFVAFTVGPMCAVNRVSSEPPSHRECAEFSARACPFLSRPHMRRRENDLPETVRAPAGEMIRRNPGVALVWVTKGYRVRQVGSGVLFQMGEPRELMCFAEGREATSDEIRESVDSGLPLLLEQAQKDGIFAVRELEKQTIVARKLLRLA